MLMNSRRPCRAQSSQSESWQPALIKRAGLKPDPLQHEAIHFVLCLIFVGSTRVSGVHLAQSDI